MVYFTLLPGSAAILRQLPGYEDDDERLGVLNAGLVVRGADFAKEMYDLTKEALTGFKRYPEGEVDPELLRRVESVDTELKEFLRDKADAWM